MFGVEIVVGVTARSASLRADALDFFGDSANYVLSLGVAGMALLWRAKAAMLKGASLIALGLWVLASTAWMAVAGMLPAPETCGSTAVRRGFANFDGQMRQGFEPVEPLLDSREPWGRLRW